ncbi:MAG: alkaline phosphatase D family protein [Verrucomicrobiales bacterium]|nr:alkaline phosphatase D family protein [Verrucomicrobiales bacterium]
MRILCIFLFFLTNASCQPSGGPHQACGCKIGEVSEASAIIWTRLTKNSSANPAGAPWFEVEYKGQGFQPASEKKNNRRPVLGVRYEEPAASAADIRWAVPGAPGATRIQYRPEGAKEWIFTEWQKVDPEQDFTRQHVLNYLEPGSLYQFVVESRNPEGGKGVSIKGSFRTAPEETDATAEVEFAVSTGQAFRDRDNDKGFNIYPAMIRQHPNLDFFVHTGDIVYYDRLAKTPDLAHYHWQRTYSLPTNVKFHNQVSSYFIKDDHDAWTNDCWPTMKSPDMGTFTFEKGLDIFVQQVPMHGRSTYRTQRWGKHVQIWLVEGRDFRSANTDPDGPEKTIWGEEQKAWFKETFAASDATFRILISPTPVVGPDRDKGKNDNHSNQVFSHEGNEIRDFLATQNNAYIICGDRHWQYHSVDPRTKLNEFSCGPASNAHAGGWKQEDYREDIHRFLRVDGGYLSVLSKGEELIFRHHSDAGEVVNEAVFQASK